MVWCIEKELFLKVPTNCGVGGGGCRGSRDAVEMSKKPEGT